MSSVNVKEFKITLDGTEYTFRLDFMALKKFDERYDNALEIFNNFLSGKNTYDCMIKILSCSCLEKDFSEEELASSLSFNFGTMKMMDKVTLALIEGVLSDNKDIKGKKQKN